MNFGKIKELVFFDKIKSFLPLSLPVKLLLSAFTMLIGSSGLGLLCDYATYKYAYQFGVRVPFEGVPYLSASVAIGSIGLLIWGAIIFAIVFMFLRLLVIQAVWNKKINDWLIEKFGQDSLFNHKIMKGNVADLSLKKRWIAIFCLSIFVFGFCMFAIYLSDRSFAWHDLIKDKLATLVVISYIFASVSAVLIPGTAWFSTTAVVIMYFLTAITLLLTPVKYANFLNSTGYGGEVGIELQVNDPTLQRELQPTSEISLILRTNDTFIVKNSMNMVFEVPRSVVMYVRYPQRTNTHVPWYLP